MVKNYDQQANEPQINPRSNILRFQQQPELSSNEGFLLMKHHADLRLFSPSPLYYITYPVSVTSNI